MNLWSSSINEVNWKTFAITESTHQVQLIPQQVKDCASRISYQDSIAFAGKDLFWGYSSQLFFLLVVTLNTNGWMNMT